MVELGQIIISNNERYEVSQIWPAGASTVIDFIAKQLKKCGTDNEGNPVYAGRGFSYAVRNWELEETMELQSVNATEIRTYKEILLDYGIYDFEIVTNMTEEQCKAECDDINREVAE